MDKKYLNSKEIILEGVKDIPILRYEVPAVFEHIENEIADLKKGIKEVKEVVDRNTDMGNYAMIKIGNMLDDLLKGTNG